LADACNVGVDEAGGRFDLTEVKSDSSRPGCDISSARRIAFL
jgi:hypothetical protein